MYVAKNVKMHYVLFIYLLLLLLLFTAQNLLQRVYTSTDNKSAKLIMWLIDAQLALL